MTRVEGAFAVDPVIVVLSERCIFVCFLGSSIWRVTSIHVPVERGNLSPSFIHLFILQPDGAMCNTEVSATTLLLYSFTGISSLFLIMWVKLH